MIVKHSYLSWRSKKYADANSVRERKLTVVKSAMAHLKYVQHRDGSDRKQSGRKFFDLENDEIGGKQVRNVVKRGMWDGQTLHKFTFSPDVNVDKLKECARAIIREVEQSKGLDLDGRIFGVVHTNTAHHHVHMVFLSKDKNGVSYRFSRDDYKFMREAGDRFLDRHYPVERDAAALGRWVRDVSETPERIFLKQGDLSQRKWHSMLAAEPELRANAVKAITDFEDRIKKTPEDNVIWLDRRKLPYESPLKLLKEVRAQHLQRVCAEQANDDEARIASNEQPLSYKQYDKLRVWIAVKEGKEALEQVDEGGLQLGGEGSPVYAALTVVHGVVKYILAQIPNDIWTKKDEMRDNLSALRDLKARMYERYQTARDRNYDVLKKLERDLREIDDVMSHAQRKKTERDTDVERQKARRPRHDFTREDFD